MKTRYKWILILALLVFLAQVPSYVFPDIAFNLLGFPIWLYYYGALHLLVVVVLYFFSRQTDRKDLR